MDRENHEAFIEGLNLEQCKGAPNRETNRLGVHS